MQGKWGRDDGEKHGNHKEASRFFGTPLPLHPLAPRTFAKCG
jgi:hypothetical protein